VIDIEPDGLHLVELAPGVTEDEVRDKTEPQQLVSHTPSHAQGF
jgi:3-oxoacid CoA-transferase subunit B